MDSFIQLLTTSPASSANAIFWAIGFILVLGIYCHLSGKRRQIVDAVPSIITSLGIFGTFIGIVAGLMDFDPQNIDGSIPTLLEGLKTAFNTSIIGMLASILFKLFLAWCQGSSNAKIEAEVDLAPAILDSIQSQSANIDKLTQAIAGQEDTSLVSQIRLMRMDFNQHIGELTAKNTSIDANIEKMAGLLGSQGDGSIVSQLKFLRDDISTIGKRHDNIFEAFRIDLNKRLEDFAEQLSSAASDQMVEALRQVIQDFNAKISEELGENFKALNDAIGKLLTWQKEYQEQLIQLEVRYREAVQLLEQSKAAMTTIAEKSESIPVAMKHLEDILARQEEEVKQLESHLKTFAEIREKAVEAVPSISQCITNMTDELKNSVSHVATELGATAQKFNDETQKATSALESTSNHLVSNSTEVTNALKQFSTDFIGTTSHMAVEVTNQTHNVLESFKQNSTKLLDDTVSYTDALQNKMIETHEATSKLIHDASNAFNQTANQVVQSTVQTTQQTMEGSRREIETVVEQIAQKTHEEINAQIKHLDEAMTRELNNALSELGSALATIAHKIADRYEEASRRGQA